MKINFLKKLFCFSALSGLCVSSVFANSIATDSKIEIHSSGIIDNTKSKGKLEPGLLQYDGLVAITGDSYAGIFCQFEDMKYFKLNAYAIAGRPVYENLSIMAKAANAPGKVLIISIGVNDHFNETEPYLFESTIRTVFELATRNKKIIFVHSYVEYPTSKNIYKRYSTSLYDEVLKRLSTSYKNVYYIDMNNYSSTKYSLSDGLHYGKEFYDILYGKIIDVLMTIDF